MQYPNRAYADHFNSAFNYVFNSLDDSAFYAATYPIEIAQTTEIAAQTALAGYIKTYHLSSNAARRLSPYVIKRERALALTNKVYVAYSSEKDQAINSVLKEYQPIIDSLIADDGNWLHTTQIDIAIKYSTELDLTEAQIEDLQYAKRQLVKLQEEYKQTDPMGEYDSKRFESAKLNEILKPEQYTQVLTVKYAGHASAMAQTDWQEMVRLGFSVDYEEYPTKVELSNYHLAVFIAYYRNAHHLEEQHLSVKRINEVMPRAMRQLLEKWEYRTPYGDTPDVFFQW